MLKIKIPKVLQGFVAAALLMQSVSAAAQVCGQAEKQQIKGLIKTRITDYWYEVEVRTVRPSQDYTIVRGLTSMGRTMDSQITRNNTRGLRNEISNYFRVLYALVAGSMPKGCATYRNCVGNILQSSGINIDGFGGVKPICNFLDGSTWRIFSSRSCNRRVVAFLKSPGRRGETVCDVFWEIVYKP
jgi:hypothetical protein